MPSTFDSLLRLELQASGENQNTWGTKTNTNLELLAAAIAGYDSAVDVTGTGDYTLVASNATADEARMHALNFTGTLVGNRTVITPATSKTYVVRNSTLGSFTLSIKPSGGTAVAIPADSSWYHVFIDGSTAHLVKAPATPFITSATASPPLTFDGDPDTGFASFGANTFTAIASATPVFTVGVSTLTVFGSVSATDAIAAGGALRVAGAANFDSTVSVSGVANFKSIVVSTSAGGPTITLSKTSTTTEAAIFGANAGSLRFGVVLTNTAAETGSNAGSDFNIIRYSDAGSALGTVMDITRSTGVTTFRNSEFPQLSLANTDSRTWSLGNEDNGFFVITDSTAGQNRLGISTAGVVAIPYSSNYTVPVSPQGVVLSPTGFIGAGNLNAADGFNFINFARNGVSIGSVSQSGGGSTVSFNTTSDYRLKENLVALSGSLDIINRLTPYEYNFKGTDVRSRGLLAHELQNYVPGAVTGAKDETDADGKPVYQSVDYSKLVPDLICAIQELTVRVKKLEAKLRDAGSNPN